MSLSSHWRGHFLLFDRKARPALDAKAALRLLIVFAVLEGLIGPRFEGLKLLGLPDPPAWLRIAILLALALLLMRYVARITFRQLGFFPWREWSVAEKSYFLQVVAIGSAAGVLLLGSRLRPEFFATALVWGFYQELFFQAPPAVGMFAAIFAIGLFFAALFHRSGNLWIVATFHGLGTAFILSAAAATSTL